MQDSHWFVTYVNYEPKQKSQRNLIVSFRNSDLIDPKITDIYINYPTLIPSFNLYSIRQLDETLEKVRDIKQVESMIIYLPSHMLFHAAYLKSKHNVVVNEHEGDSLSINIFLPNNPEIIGTLPSTKISGFQTGSYSRITKRYLNILNRKVNLDEKLEQALIKKNEIRNAETELIYQIDNLPLEKKPHLIYKQLFEFFSNYNGSFKIDDVLNLAKARKLFRLHKYLSENNPEKILNLENRISENLGEIRKLVRQVDTSNDLTIDSGALNYRIFLYYHKENKGLNILGVKGIEFQEHLYKELTQQNIAYFDIEKPLWKRKDEKILLDRRDELLKLKSLPNYRSSDKQKRINRLVNELEEKLTINFNGSIIPLYDKRFDAIINNITLLVANNVNVGLRQYYKINYNPGAEPDLFGYKVFNFCNERDLLNEFFYQLRKTESYFLSNHVIPYDLIQTRDAFLEHKLHKKFDLATQFLNPKRDAVRKVYQRVLSPGQEIIDTHRLMFNFFPFLKSKYGTSHRLEDSARFIRSLRKIDREFKKIATHEELRDLVLESMLGNKEAELTLDNYTIRDVEDPLRDIVEYPLFMDIALKVKKLMPHVSLTSIMFSPSIMEELHKTIHFEKNHNERYFGYEEKVREDEKEIFKKRYGVLKSRLFEKNSIKILNQDAEDVVQAYMPVELWLKDFLIHLFPGWRQYFDALPGDHLEKFAALRYPNYFLQDPLIDYYFYIRERNIYYNNLSKISLDKGEAKLIFSELERKILSLNKLFLLNAYDRTYERLKNNYRSIYAKAPRDLRSLIRLKPIHLFFEEHPQAESLLGFKLFEQDNKDLIDLRNIPEEFIKQFKDNVKTLNKRYASTYDTFLETSRDLEAIVNGVIPQIEKFDLIYLLNQRRRATRRAKKFKSFYNENPEHFDFIFNFAFEQLSRELKQNNLQAVGLQGDYLFIKDDLPKESMLIPIRKIPAYTKT